jgi:hypothetical protein
MVEKPLKTILADVRLDEPPDQTTKNPRPVPVYAGILAKPVVLDESLCPGLDQLGPKIAALFDHFNVERWNFVALSMELAHRHVPGFAFQKSAGAPVRWSPFNQVHLIRAVSRHQTASINITAACQCIAEAGTFGKASARTLERRYYAAKNDKKIIRMAEVVAKLESLDRTGGMTSLFDDELRKL